MGREVTGTKQRATEGPRLAVVAEAFCDRSLIELLDWLLENTPEITAVELGAGGYAPHPHCDCAVLLGDRSARRQWFAEFERRGIAIAALNAWGNPLHPDPTIGALHDSDLRAAIRLASELGVDRVVALAGCPPAAPGDGVPNFASGGWLPYLEDVYDTQWEAFVAPYWSELSKFARTENPELRICIELHPGTAVYNVETFSRLAGLGDNLHATIDPSHFFWQQMDAEAVIGALRSSIGHVHAKDLVFNEQRLATEGLLDHRWRGSTADGPWRFATLGEGHDAGWWGEFLAWLGGAPFTAIAIEHEDPLVPAEIGVSRAAALLAGALAAAPALVELSR